MHFHHKDIIFCRYKDTAITNKKSTMKKCRKFLGITALFCCLSLGVKAQSTGGKLLPPVEIETGKISIMKIDITSNGKKISNNDTIQQGDTLLFRVKWDKNIIDKFIFRGVKYKPNKEEILKGEYSFIEIPKFTRKYKIICCFKCLEQLENLLKGDSDEEITFDGFQRKVVTFCKIFVNCD